MASNEFYDSSGYPSTRGKGNSLQARAEFDAIEAGFVKLPAMLGNGLKLVQVNSGGTALEATGTPTLGAATATTINKITFTTPGTGATLTLANGSTLATVGAFAYTFTFSAATTVTFPTTGTLATLAGTENLTNKSINGIALPPDHFFTPGYVKLTLKTTADSGWVLMNDGTIGNASSGGTSRANADTSALFTLLWTNTANADCAVSTGRGGSAAADYAANKTIALPKALGRALAGYGSGSGLTARALAHVVGEESHTQTVAEMVSHNHSPAAGAQFVGTDGTIGLADTGGIYYKTTAAAATTASNGGGNPFNVMQPTLFLNVMIKL